MCVSTWHVAACSDSKTIGVSSPSAVEDVPPYESTGQHNQNSVGTCCGQRVAAVVGASSRSLLYLIMSELADASGKSEPEVAPRLAPIFTPQTTQPQPQGSVCPAALHSDIMTAAK
uniref:Uncharacterized protein n=1 Tax=Eutreptiella gymnastica TaxID=73025 RepID=A0A7S4LDE0_9EUGL